MQKEPYGVLILHGFTASLDCVREIEPPIKALGLPTRMPVLRGHNAESPEALRGVTWHDWIADAESAFQDLSTEAEKIIIIGHSMGGLVTLNLAADHGEKVDSIIIAAAAIQMSTPFAPGKSLSFLAPLMKILFKNWKVAQDKYADKSLAQYNTNYLWAPTETIISVFDFSKATRKRLPEVKTPTLIINSHNDSTVDAVSVEIISNNISTPREAIKIVWFEKTEHEMFRDTERYDIINVITNYVRERIGGV